MKKRKMIAVLLSTVMLGSLAGCGSDVRTEGEKKMSYEDASSELSSLLKKVSIRTVSNPTLDIYMDETSKADALDDIDTFPITVRGNGDIDIEVAAATEMSADAPDDWMNVVAKNFNKEGYKIDGQTVSVSVRKIPILSLLRIRSSGASFLRFSSSLASRFPWDRRYRFAAMV